MGRVNYYRVPTTKLKTGPSIFPVTVNQVKAYLGIDEDNNYFNSLLTNLLAGAIERIESGTNRRLITQHWYQYEFDWPLDRDYFELRYNPVQSINSLSYKNYGSSSYTAWASSNYELDESAEPARLWIVDSASWPSMSLSDIKPIRIDYEVGYGDNVEDVDPELVMAIFQIVEHWFENRGTIVTGTIVANLPDTAKEIIAQKKIIWL